MTHLIMIQSLRTYCTVAVCIIHICRFHREGNNKYMKKRTYGNTLMYNIKIILK